MNAMTRHLRTLALLIALLTLPPLTRGQELPQVKPEAVGMSSEKLAKVDEVMQQYVRREQLAGVVVCICRRGKVAHFRAYGMMDREANKPMRKDTIMRVYSMSKAITTAAALMLCEEGKIGLDDPVAKHIPEFRSLQALQGEGVVAVKQPPTIRDLMRHTAGFSYGFMGEGKVERQYQRANVLDNSGTLKDMARKLGEIPLLYEPGTDWAYSVSVDVLGHVVERASGTLLDVFLKKRVFEPLDMRDTAFSVPPEKLDRFAANYRTTDGKLVLEDAPSTSRFGKPATFFSGGGGLVSTARDYVRFLVMINGGGQFNGKSLLKQESVALMTQNQLPEKIGWIKLGGFRREGVGFGLGFSVREKKSLLDPHGRVGEYGWGGAASTHYWVSPRDDLIVVTLEQTFPFNFLTEFGTKGLIYTALED